MSTLPESGIDTDGEQDLRIVAVVPEKVQYDAKEQVVIVFNQSLPRKGPFMVDFVGKHGQMQVVAKQLNSCTLQLQSPPYCPVEEVTACVYHGVNRILLGKHHFKFTTRYEAMLSLIHGALDPVTFMCESLGISPLDIPSLDGAMAAAFQRNTPDGFAFLEVEHAKGEINGGSEQPRQSPLKCPTLLHFASKYGLASLVKNLLDCRGALQACLMRNSDFQRPDNLAEDSGHLELAKSLRSFGASSQHRAEDESGDFYEDMRTPGDEPFYVEMNNDPEAEYIDMDGRRYYYCTKQEGTEYYTYTNTRAYQNSTRGDGAGDEDDIYYVDMKSQALDYIDRNGRRYYYLPDQNRPGENKDSEQFYEEIDNPPGAGPIYDVPKSNAPVEEIARSVSVSMSQQQKRRLNSKRQVNKETELKNEQQEAVSRSGSTGSRNSSVSTISSTSSSSYSSSREEEEEPDRVSRREILEQLKKEKQKDTREMNEAPLHKEKQKETREMNEAPLPPPPDYQHKASTLPSTSSGPPSAKPRVQTKHASFHQADRRKERPPALRPRRPSEPIAYKSFESRDEKRDSRVPSAPMEERPPPPLPREKEKDPSSPRLPTPKPRSKKY